MRFIDIDRMSPSEEWKAKAATQQKEITDGAKEPDACGETWRALRDELARLSAKKCYYCEAFLTRAAFDVDHFRPKSLYRFLALTPTNFRLACHYCNRLHRNPETGRVEGKGKNFPLIDNGAHAASETDLVLENPALLDPCNAADPLLLGFLADGSACAADPEDETLAKRVAISETLFSLNEPKVKTARHEVARAVAAKVADIMVAVARHPRHADHWPQVSAHVRDLKQLIRGEAEFSAFARAMLRTHRGKPWVDRILDTA